MQTHTCTQHQQQTHATFSFDRQKHAAFDCDNYNATEFLLSLHVPTVLHAHNILQLASHILIHQTMFFFDQTLNYFTVYLC
jgi:hypothetical protein